ncbi:MAG: hypothetical protein IKL00_02280, partial [Oscillospiraceae bacterium]|nr:hypothetical protein [Oscillospiraceae bacterium]
QILVYAAKVGAGESSTLQESPEKEAAALSVSDIDKNGEINSTDAAYILTYAAMVGSGKDADWDAIVAGA